SLLRLPLPRTTDRSAGSFVFGISPPSTADLLLRRWLLPPSRKWGQHSVSVGLDTRCILGAATTAAYGAENLKASSRRRTAMSTARLVTSILIAILASGCAMHTPPPVMDARPVGTDDKVGAVAANLWYVPSRAFLCGVGTTISALVMTVTLGQGYDSASAIMHGGSNVPFGLQTTSLSPAAPLAWFWPQTLSARLLT